MAGPGKPFAKGTPKPANSGRKKGTPNKRTAEMVQTVRDICTKYGQDPIETMAQLMRDADDEHLRFQCAKELASYMYAKFPRAVHVSGPDGKDLNVNNSSLVSIGLDCEKAVEAYLAERDAQAKK